MTDLFFPKKKKNVALLVTAHRSSMNLNVPWSLDVLGYFNEIRFWTYLDSKIKKYVCWECSFINLQQEINKYLKNRNE